MGKSHWYVACLELRLGTPKFGSVQEPTPFLRTENRTDSAIAGPTRTGEDVGWATWRERSRLGRVLSIENVIESLRQARTKIAWLDSSEWFSEPITQDKRRVRSRSFRVEFEPCSSHKRRQEQEPSSRFTAEWPRTETEHSAESRNSADFQHDAGSMNQKPETKRCQTAERTQRRCRWQRVRCQTDVYQLSTVPNSQDESNEPDQTMRNTRRQTSMNQA